MIDKAYRYTTVCRTADLLEADKCTTYETDRRSCRQTTALRTLPVTIMLKYSIILSGQLQEPRHIPSLIIHNQGL